MERKNAANFFADFIMNDTDNPVDEIKWLVMNLKDDAFESIVEQKEKEKFFPVKRLWARQCDITKKGMNEGWVWADGSFYTNTLEDTLSECRKDRDSILSILTEIQDMHDIQDPSMWANFLRAVNAAEKGTDTDDNLLTIAYQCNLCYFTEWYENDDDEFMFAELEDGTIVALT